MPDLKKIFSHSLVLVLWCVGVVAALASDYEPYVSRTEIPDALVYLPAPPDSSQVATNGDYARWLWGRAQRNTPRGEQASWETKYGMVRMCTIYSDVLGIDITEDDTPAIYRLMARAGATGALSVSASNRKLTSLFCPESKPKKFLLMMSNNSLCFPAIVAVRILCARKHNLSLKSSIYP